LRHRREGVQSERSDGQETRQQLKVAAGFSTLGVLVQLQLHYRVVQLMQNVCRICWRPI
jgi:hypothetical protein